MQRALQAFALLLLALAGQAVLAQAVRPIQIWPTIPFVRGKDLCQYQENYAKTKNEQSKDMLQNVVALIREGAQKMGKVADSKSWVTQIYEAALSRKPATREMETSLEILGTNPQSEQVEDLLWSIFMLPEFFYIN